MVAKSGDKYDCGYPFIAMLYFVSYQIAGALVMMNLMVGVVISNFDTECTAASEFAEFARLL